MTITRDHPWVGKPQENPVVVGVEPDQDPTVLTRGLALAERMRTGLLCVWVDPVHLIPPAKSGVHGTSGDSSGADTEALLVALLHRQLKDRSTPWRFVYTAGEAPRGIARVAREYQAATVVVGSRRPHPGGWMNEMFGGSIAAHLAHTQDIPVTIVPLASRRQAP